MHVHTRTKGRKLIANDCLLTDKDILKKTTHHLPCFCLGAHCGAIHVPELPIGSD